jgi:hypothetical protein
MNVFHTSTPDITGNILFKLLIFQDLKVRGEIALDKKVVLPLAIML